MDRKSIKSKAFSIANNMGAWLLIIVIIVLMAFVNDKFLTVSNIINVLRQVCVVAICALGVSFVVLGGEIDLSSGMAATFAGCNAALLITRLAAGTGDTAGSSAGRCGGNDVRLYRYLLENPVLYRNVRSPIYHPGLNLNHY